MSRPPARAASRRLVAALALSLTAAVSATSSAVAAPTPATTTASATAVCPPSGGVGVAPAPAPAGAEVVVQGHGFGHGMGLSQYGAQGAALLGCSAGTILRTYYPGLAPASRPLGARVLVRMLDAGGDRGRAEVLAESGPVTWRSGTRTAVQPKGATWTVRRDGTGLLVQSGTAATSPRVPALSTASGTPLRAEHGGVVTRVATWSATGAAGLVRRSDGDHTRFTGGASGLAVREVMEDDARGTAVQKYLGGLAEMPVSWPVAAQEAQVVAARTYLTARWSAAEGGYLVRPTTSDQVWNGYDQEVQDARYGSRLAQAVAGTSSGTSGTVMVTGSGALARDLFYASSHGGWSETNAYVWGTSPVPHLAQVDDSRWDSASSNPYRSWSVGMSLTQVAKAFDFTSVSDISVAPRGSASRTGVAVTGVRAGKATTARFTGQQVRDRLRAVDPAVRSSGFTFVVRTTPPAPSVPTPSVPPPAAAPAAPAVVMPTGVSTGVTISARWAALGGERGVLGRATTSERATPAPVAGRYRHFAKGSLYDSPVTDPQVVKGRIREMWGSVGWERSFLGFPITDERAVPGGGGFYSHFRRGSVYWSPGTGAHEVHGRIRERWAAMGWERSALGFPVTDERRTPDGKGFYNHFRGGSVYYTAATGAHEVLGATRDRWASMGWERSALGYPTSRAVPTATGSTTFFQGGAIRWASATGATTVELT